MNITTNLSQDVIRKYDHLAKTARTIKPLYVGINSIRKLTILGVLLLFQFGTQLNGQYFESFSIAGKGILSGPCGTNDPSSCFSTDFTGVDWTIGGNLSGIDTEGFMTTGGYLLSEDLDEEACWISPTLDISTAGPVSLVARITIPSGAAWESSTTVGSIDYANVEYSIDGGPYVTIANVNGCGSNSFTISNSGCGVNLIGPLTYLPSASGITGNTLDIRVCFDTNASTDDGWLEEVGVPQSGVVVYVPIVCPTVGSVSTSVANVCPNAPFNVTASGLVGLDAATNMEQDFGVEFVAFSSTPMDPYSGGTSLGTVAFGSLTGGGTTAELTGASLASSGTYEVYAILSPAPNDGSCRPSAMTSITIDPLDNASFSYSAAAYCVDAADPTPTITGLSGGSFSASPAGLSINPMTGTIDVSASTPNTYTVTYTTSGACPNSSNVSVTINALDNASFSYSAAAYCVNAADPTPTITGLSGGSFSSTPVGLSINSMTGTIDVSASTPNTYTVTYTTSGACPNSSNVSVTINALDDASFSYSASAYCVDDSDPTPTITGLPGGTFSSTPVGLSINSLTGTIDVSASTPNIYTVSYITSGNCPNVSNVTVTINALDDASFSYNALAYCVDASDPTPTVTGLGGGTFTSSPTGLAMNPMTGAIDVSASIPNTYSVTYSTSGTCPNSSSVDVTIAPLPVVGFTAPEDLCIDAGVQTGLSGGTPAGISPGCEISSITNTGINGWLTEVGQSMGQTFIACEDGFITTVSFTTTDNTVAGNHMLTVGPSTNPPTALISGGVTFPFSTTGGSELISLVLPMPFPVTSGSVYAFEFQAGAVPLGSLFKDNATYLGGNEYNNISGFINSQDSDLDFTVEVSTPSGTGMYSGPGVTDHGNGMTYNFDPSAAGVGEHVITYSFTDSVGCSNAASDTVEVFDLPMVSLTTAFGYCIDSALQSLPLTGGTPAGGVYSGVGVTDLGDGVSYYLDPTVNGPGVVTVTYTYTDANGCTNADQSDIEIYECGFEVADPCFCLNNATRIEGDYLSGGDDGQFSEVVSVTGAGGGQLPGGQTWTVVGGSGMFDAFNVPPVGMQSAGIPVATDGSVVLFYEGDIGHYELPFVHIDNMGYSIEVEGPFGAGSPANVTLTISNKCWYPNPEFDPVIPDVINTNDPVITLGGIDGNGNGVESINFELDGNPETEIDPAGLPLGFHTAVMFFDGMDDGNGGISPDGGITAASPGCVQEIEKVFELIECELIVDCSNIVDQTLACRSDLPAVNFNLPIIVDACGETFLSALTIIPGDSGCPGDTLFITRTYFIQDDEGNQAQCMQTFTVISTMDPEFTFVPNDTMVLCGEPTDPSATGAATGVGECHPAVPQATVTFSDAIEAGDCPREMVITRTWTVTDRCGRSVSTDQIIMVIDTVAPTFDQMPLPGDETVECSEIPDPEELTATDNCSTTEITLMISEIHYDNTGTDQGEFVEVMGTAGFDLSNCQLVLYNGSNSMTYGMMSLSGSIDDEGNGYGAVGFDYPTNGLQNGAPDGVALICNGQVVDFISYEGTITAIGGPADGMTSVDIGEEPGSTPVGQSLQLMGTGCLQGSFSWSNGPQAASPGSINSGLVIDPNLCPVDFGATVTFSEVFTPGNTCPQEGELVRTWIADDGCGNTTTHMQILTIIDTQGPVICDAPADTIIDCDAIVPPAPVVTAYDLCDNFGADIWINEIHYDNTGADTGEFVELAGNSGADLSEYTLELYNGSNGTVYETLMLTGEFPNEGCGFGALAFSTPGLQNGSPDGVALVHNGTVVQFLSYEGTFVATGGSASGMSSTDIGVAEPGDVGESLQLRGIGSTYSDFTWTGPLAESPGALNAGQALQASIVASLVETTAPGNCPQEMIITRTWSAMDECGNMATDVIQTIMIQDTTPPSVTCQDITIYLDANGEGTLAPDDVITFASDNCSANNDMTYAVSRADFNCMDTNPNTLPFCERSFDLNVTVEDECNNVTTCNFVATVQDTLAPVLTCPNDLIVSLDAGECGEIYNFVPPFAIDNCEGMLQTTFLGTTFIDNNGFAGNMFDVENIGPLPITITMFDLHFATNAGTPHVAEVWYTTTDDTYVGHETDAAAWTSLGSSPAISAGPGQPTPLAVGGLTLQPGQRIGLYVAQTDGGQDIDYTNGANNYTDANLSITTGVGKGLPTFTGGTFNPRTWNGNIHYTFLTGNISMVQQTAGTDLMSGDFFDDGSYFWTYQADDGCGNVSECTFTLDIIPFPLEDVTTSLNCNNMVNISLSPDCEACINADMILEGGPYTCYDDYLVSSTYGAGMVVDASFGSGTYLCLGPDDIGKIIEVKITDPLTGNSCWGNVRVEDKLPPVIDCPDRQIVKCYEYGNVSITDPLVTDCSDFDLYFTDSASGDDCEGRLITRTYVAIDENGLSSSCSIIIQVNPLDSEEDIIDPASLVQLTCGSGTDPQSIASYFDDPSTPNNEGYKYAYPTFVIDTDTFKVDPGVCDFYADYKDHEIDACGAHCHGNKKIIRTWTYLDWCDPTNFRKVTQLINAKDVEGPTFIVKDTTVSTRPWDCTGEFIVPAPWELHDNCDIAPYYTVSGPVGVTITPKPGGGWIASGATKGIHEFYYTGWDCCGNSTTKSAMIAVLDYVAPVVTTKRDIVVSLTPGGLVDTSALAKIYCSNVDNGSYDFCSNVYCEIRRPQGSPLCDNIGVNGHNNNMTYNNTDVKFLSGNHPDDNRDDTDGGQYVKFCCDDINRIEGDANEDGVIDSLDAGYVKVIIRVWDDANMSGAYGDEASPFPGLAAQKDNYNEGWAWVKVECKSIPVIVCPPADTVKCYWDVKFDPAAGWRKVSEVDLSKSGYATAFGCCGPMEVEFSDAGNLQECQEGTFVRTFRTGYIGIDGNQQYVQCQQRITVLRDEYVVTVTPKNRDFANPSCTFDPSIIDQARPTINGGPCDVIGENVTVDTFLFENGVCKKWRITYEYWNWCKQEAYGPFTEYAIYEDTDDPVIMTCQDTCISVGANCEAVVTLTNAAFDLSECTDNEWIKWVVEIDMWADGTVDAVAATHYTQRNWTLVSDPWYGDIYVINLPATSSKDSLDQTMDQLSDDQIATVTFPEIIAGKMSNHKVTWKAIDGCHNESGCSYNVMVADKKAPTPYCVSLSSAIMTDGTVELWAKDFDRGSFDNCTDEDDLLFTFNQLKGAFEDTIITVGGRDYLVNADIPQFFDESGFVGFDGDGVVSDANGNIIPPATDANLVKYGNGDIQRWKPAYKSSAKVFDCDEFEAQGPNGAPVEMTVWDKKGNNDFCLVYLTLLDSHGGCNPFAPRVSGTIITDLNEPLMQTMVTIEGDVNDLTKVMVGDGAYEFQVPAGANYQVRAEKDVDYMNGVSTLDLVLIQRHILGLAELDTEYKMISADVNNDMNIRANDLVELRKLILGITNDFTATSWKIVDAKDDIEMVTPLVYSEVVNVPNLQSDVTDADFIATKVGDVSGDAKSNVRSQNVDSRSQSELHFVIDDQEVAAGQAIDVAVTSSNFTAVYGYQFSGRLNGLALTGVRPGVIDMNDSHVGLPSLDVMTASWASDEMVSAVEGEVLFTIEFVATKNGRLSEMLSLNSEITKAESYVGTDMEVGQVDLTFRDELVGSDVIRNELYQNEPNPFKGTTKIGYELAKAGTATFTMYDVTGKVLFNTTVDAERGMNTLEVNAGQLNVTGIVYYQIESGDFIATKKMIVLE